MAKATLTHGRNGGRAHDWIAGVPQGFSRQYVFPAGRALEIDDADAALIQTGKAELGGRVFEVVRDPKPAAPPVTMTTDLGDGPAVPKGKA